MRARGTSARDHVEIRPVNARLRIFSTTHRRIWGKRPKHETLRRPFPRAAVIPFAARSRTIIRWLDLAVLI